MDTTKTVADVINPFLNELKRRAATSTYYEAALEWVEENENKKINILSEADLKYLSELKENLGKAYR